MEMEFFIQSMAELCAHSLVAPERRLVWTIIANPCAGGFTIRSRWKKHCRILEDYRYKARENPVRPHSGFSDTAQAGGGIVLTTGPGHAGQITRVLIDEALSALDASAGSGAAENPFYLIITAGGDGTSLEVLSSVYHAPARIRSSLAVLRLPMGTGNDGADGLTLDRALELLVKPTAVTYTPALTLVTAAGGPAESKGPFLAFNILSVGLDAFVTHMTNKMKGKLPGDSYKLWVDIASLLYDSLYTVDFMDVRAMDEQGNEVIRFREKLLLLAMGISGGRTYGAQKKILPDERNVCGIKQMPLLRKLVLKELFTKGTHISKPEAIPFSAHRVEFSGLHPLLAQMDGEAVLLEKADFPAAIELTEKVIPVLKLI
jgi:diacylglycerol kinase family enzyme